MAPSPTETHPTTADALRLGLSGAGIVHFGDLVPRDTVTAWNDALDPVFRADRSERAHVGADLLAETGVLQACLAPGVRALVAATAPDARLYHAHAYEIAAAADRPHIHAGRLAGWHRDTETIHDYRPGAARHISLFVYLSDVGDDSGAFELAPWPPETVRPGCLGAHRMTGPAGTTFAWNRSYYHRASPNRSPVRRRLLKLSWQPAGLRNDRIALPEFTRAAAAVDGDEWLTVLLGGAGAHAALPPTAGVAPRPVGLELDTSVSFGRLEHLGERVRSLRHRALAS